MWVKINYEQQPYFKARRKYKKMMRRIKVRLDRIYHIPLDDPTPFNKGKRRAKQLRLGKRLNSNLYSKLRRQDWVFCFSIRLSHRLRARLSGILRKKKVQKIIKFKEYGIDVEAIVNKVGFRPSKDFELDHIIPCAAYDFSNPEDIKKCFSPGNLRWITGTENSRKSAHWEDNGVKYFGKKKLS